MRKKILTGFTMVLVVGLLLSVGTVFAATPAEPTAPIPGNGTCLGLGQARGPMLPTIAEMLELTPAEVATQRREGKSIVEIAATQGVSEQELVNKVVSLRAESLNQLVEDGKLTQEQADQYRQTMSERITANLNRTATGPANGERGFGGCRSGAAQGRFGQGAGGQRMGQGFGNQANRPAIAQ